VTKNEETVTSRRLHEIRAKKGYTLLEVQQKLGINHKTLSGYEVAKSKPDPETLAKLAMFYEVSVDWLVGTTNNPKGVLSEDQREAAQAVNMDDDSFLDLPFYFNGKLLTREEKVKLKSMAALLLDKDR